MKEYIKGTYKRLIYSSNDYIIGLVKIEETNIDSMKDYINKLVTFTGYFHELTLNDNYVFYGKETIHPRYGFQYDVLEYEKILPQDKDGIVMFLSSDLFKGIGVKLATKIVETLGTKTLDRILEEPECLNLVPTLTEKKAKLIIETLNKYEESHQTIVYLTEIGFSLKDALAIYNKLKGARKMELTIYADVLFGFNYFMNFLQ